LVAAGFTQDKTALGIMSPTSRFLDTPGGVDLPVAAVGVGLQDATVVLQVVLRVLALAVG
jgi:hypothetical protein